MNPLDWYYIWTTGSITGILTIEENLTKLHRKDKNMIFVVGAKLLDWVCREPVASIGESLES